MREAQVTLALLVYEVSFATRLRIWESCVNPRHLEDIGKLRDALVGISILHFFFCHVGNDEAHKTLKMLMKSSMRRSRMVTSSVNSVSTSAMFDLRSGMISTIV